MDRPGVALLNSITDGDNFSDTLANMFGTSLNGATLNLDSMLPMINEAAGDFLPEGASIGHLDIAFGGWLTAGHVAIDPYQVIGENGEVAAETPAVGGSILNSVGLTLNGVPVLGALEIDSNAVGPWGRRWAWGRPSVRCWDRAGTARARCRSPRRWPAATYRSSPTSTTAVPVAPRPARRSRTCWRVGVCNPDGQSLIPARPAIPKPDFSDERYST